MSAKGFEKNQIPVAIGSVFIVVAIMFLLENLVALQLRKTYWDPEEPRLFYYKRGDVDLDFYIPDEKMAVQASYDLTDETTYNREVGTLVAFNKVFKVEKAIIVTYDTEDTIVKDGLTIEVVPIWKWLIKE